MSIAKIRMFSGSQRSDEMVNVPADAGWSHVPWQSHEELSELRECILSKEWSKIQRAVEKVHSWEAVHQSVPLKILATCQLLQVAVRDPICTPAPESIQQLGALSDQELASGYAVSIVRLFSSVVDPLRRSASSVDVIAVKQGLPASCTEARHQIVHRGMPSLEYLRTVANHGMAYLITHFWNRFIPVQGEQDIQKTLQAYFEMAGEIGEASSTVGRPKRYALRAWGLRLDDSSDEEMDEQDKKTTPEQNPREKRARRDVDSQVSGMLAVLNSFKPEKLAESIIDCVHPKEVNQNGLQHLFANSIGLDVALTWACLSHFLQGDNKRKSELASEWLEWLFASKRCCQFPRSDIQSIISCLLTILHGQTHSPYRKPTTRTGQVSKMLHSLLNAAKSMGMKDEAINKINELMEMCNADDQRDASVMDFDENNGENENVGNDQNGGPVEGYIPLSVDEPPGVVNVSDVDCIEEKLEKMIKQFNSGNGGSDVTAGPWKLCEHWVPCAIGTIATANIKLDDYLGIPQSHLGKFQERVQNAQNDLGSEVDWFNRTESKDNRDAPAQPTNQQGCDENERSHFEKSEGPRSLPASFRKKSTSVSLLMAQVQFRGKVQYLVGSDDIECRCGGLLEVGGVLGMDMEWKVSFRKGTRERKTALIQLCHKRREDQQSHEEDVDASSQYTSLLIHVTHGGITPSLKALLESPDIKKVGANINGDAQKLERDYGLQVQGCVDLAEEAASRQLPDGLPTPDGLVAFHSPKGLRGLCQRLLDADMYKGNDVRCSNWELLPLTNTQKKYAALDAFVSLRCYEELLNRPLSEKPTAQSSENHSMPRTRPDQSLDQNKDQHLDQKMDKNMDQKDQGFVAALDTVTRLPFSKKEVYKLFMEDRKSIHSIVKIKPLQPQTVESYLADAVLTGRSYDWKRFGVSDYMLMCVIKLVGACVPLGNNQVQSKGSLPLNVEQYRKEQGVELDQPAWKLIESFLVDLKTVLEQRGEMKKASEGVLNFGWLVRNWGCRMSDFRAELPEGCGYGVINLCLAHSARLIQKEDAPQHSKGVNETNDGNDGGNENGVGVVVVDE